MKKTKLMFSLAVITALSSLFFGITGCEKDGDTGSDLDAYFAANPFLSDPRDESGETKNGMTIEPATITATALGQQINFVVTGGNSPYTWGVSIPSVGSVAGQGNTRYAVYTVSQLSKNNVIASDASGRSAIANITSGAGGLAITPSSTTLTSGYYATNAPLSGTTNRIPADLDDTKINFFATGGTPPYGSWQVSNTNLGEIISTGVYTVHGNWGIGENKVIITDNAGAIATATVTIQFKP